MSVKTTVARIVSGAGAGRATPTNSRIRSTHAGPSSAVHAVPGIAAISAFGICDAMWCTSSTL
jgi:hypothetical protein